MIKVSGLIHKRSNKSDNRLARLMLQNIYLMNFYIEKKEEMNAAMLLASISEHGKSNKVNKDLEASRNNA